MSSPQETQNEIQHCVIWQQLDGFGSEHCNLIKDESVWRINGSVLTILENKPACVHYHVTCDSAWRTNHVQVQMQLGRQTESLTLLKTEQWMWQINGQDAPLFGQCIDIDLGITPATNTLPIRRLNLGDGEAAEVFAIWVRFPSLMVEILPQKYTRLSASKYRYESRNGAFVTEIEVDRLGLVTTYPDLWERIGSC